VKRLAIVSTHPIQYNAPWFKLLTERKNIEVCAFYTWEQSSANSFFDKDFGRNIQWDIPLLDEYSYKFVKNTAKDPGVHHFFGIDNPTLNKEIEQWKPDAILMIRWSFIGHLKCLWHFHNKIPVLFRGDSTLLDEKRDLKRIVRTIVLKQVYRLVDYAFYVGTHSKKYFLRQGFKPANLFFVPHAIDNDRFSDSTATLKGEIEAKRNGFGIRSGQVVFLFAGKLEPKKDPEILIQAFLRLDSKDAHLVMVGNGVEEARLKSLYSSNLNLHFVDFQNQSGMPLMYGMCDVFVLPSKGPEETWGLAINEAMACKKPVLVSDKCGGAVDLVQAGLNGYIFQNQDVDDLVAKMKLLMDQRNSLQGMGEASFKYIQKYSFNEVCHQIENFMEQKV
jgi:glycosyltransferase involved in cell wall biosynthesis